LDWDSFARQSVAWMRQCGRRRIALIGLGESPILEGTERELARVGLPAPPAWVLTAKHPPTANAITQLLMSLPRSARPDGIIVVDDDVVGYVWEGLKASGVQLGKTLDVVSHVNWPWPAVSGVPVRRLGYDMRDALRRSLDMIDAMRAGRTFQRLELIPAIFEESVEKPSDRLKESSPA
jgi:DNA-binding LacI/PurR family transcriptional regulator